MKLFITLITCAFIVGCDEEQKQSSNVHNDEVVYQMGRGNFPVRVKVIILDGNEYYATPIHGGWSLCPKLPTKNQNN